MSTVEVIRKIKDIESKLNSGVPIFYSSSYPTLSDKNSADLAPKLRYLADLLDASSVAGPAFGDGVATLLTSEIGSATDIFRPIRRGQLLFADGFESANLKWNTGSTVGTPTITITSAAKQVLHGNNAVLLTTGSVGVSPDAYIENRIVCPPSKRLLIGAWLNAPDMTNISVMEFAVHIYSGTKDYLVGFMFGTPWFRYTKSDGTLGTASTKQWNPINVTDSIWFPLFCEVDTLNWKYYRLYTPVGAIDLSTQSLYSVSQTNEMNTIYTRIRVVSSGVDLATSMLADDFSISVVEALT